MSHLFGEAAPEIVVRDEHHHPAILRLEYLRGDDVRVCRQRIAAGGLARIEPGARKVVELRQHDVVHGDVDLAALPFHEFGEQAHRSHDACGIVDRRIAGLGRGTVRVAGQGHDAGERLDHVVVGRTLGVRALESIAGERDTDDLRVPALYAFVGQPELLDRRGSQVRDQRARRGYELSESLAARLGSKVEHDAFLVAVQAREVGVVRTYGMRTDAAPDVPCRTGLDLDDFRPEIREQHAAVRTHEHVPDLDDADSGERPAHLSALTTAAMTSSSRISLVNTPFTPMASSAARSSSGMVPPTNTTTSSAPMAASC